MKRIGLALAVLASGAAMPSASEVDPPDSRSLERAQRQYERRYAPPPPRYYEPPPRYIPAPRVPLGDICLIEGSRSERTCDLRRAAPLNSYCECISPSGRARGGRVVR